MGITGLLPFLKELNAIYPVNLDTLGTCFAQTLLEDTSPDGRDGPAPKVTVSTPEVGGVGDRRRSRGGNFTFTPLSTSAGNLRLLDAHPKARGKIGDRKGSPTTTLSAAVDAYSWIHKGAFACSEALYLGDAETAKACYVKYCLKYVDLLLDHGIRPVLVFDGTPLSAKDHYTDSLRRERRTEARAKADSFMARGLVKQAREYFPRCIDVTFEMAHHVIEACRANGIEYIVAPYEADAQMAFLQMFGLVDFVITEDSDLVVFGCEKILFKLDINGNGEFYEKSRLIRSFAVPPSSAPVKSFPGSQPTTWSTSPLLAPDLSCGTKKLLRSSSQSLSQGSSPPSGSRPGCASPRSSPTATSSLPNFDFLKFQYMCIMSGCDYLPSLPNVGLGKARRFFSLPLTRRHPKHLLPRMPSYLKMPGLKVTPAYVEHFSAAHRLFLFQTVFDPSTSRLRPLLANVGDLVALLELSSGSPEFRSENLEAVLGDGAFGLREESGGLDRPSDGDRLNAAIKDLCPLMRETTRSSPPSDRGTVLDLVMGNIDVTDHRLPVVDSYCCYNRKFLPRAKTSGSSPSGDRISASRDDISHPGAFAAPVGNIIWKLGERSPSGTTPKNGVLPKISGRGDAMTLYPTDMSLVIDGFDLGPWEEMRIGPPETKRLDQSPQLRDSGIVADSGNDPVDTYYDDYGGRAMARGKERNGQKSPVPTVKRTGKSSRYFGVYSSATAIDPDMVAAEGSRNISTRIAGDDKSLSTHPKSHYVDVTKSDLGSSSNVRPGPIDNRRPYDIGNGSGGARPLPDATLETEEITSSGVERSPLKELNGSPPRRSLRSNVKGKAMAEARVEDVSSKPKNAVPESPLNYSTRSSRLLLTPIKSLKRDQTRLSSAMPQDAQLVTKRQTSLKSFLKDRLSNRSQLNKTFPDLSPLSNYRVLNCSLDYSPSTNQADEGISTPDNNLESPKFKKSRSKLILAQKGYNVKGRNNGECDITDLEQTTHLKNILSQYRYPRQK